MGKRFGTVPREVPNNRSMDVLAPQFRALVDEVLAGMRADGHDPIVIETLRTHERQAFLYGFGRDYDDGRGIVTHSQDASETWHGYGLAVDIISATHRWNASAGFWTSLGTHARRAGLLWGADWNNNGRTDDERFLDRPHIQWGAMRRTPSPRALALQQQGGNLAVWREVGAA